MKYLQLIFVLIGVTHQQHPQVFTPLGDILGSLLTTRLNRTIYAFRGIRYAQPPVGDLRFKPPVPVEKWSNVYNATTDGPVCPQPSDDPVSEDCLLLNVYTTKLPDVNSTEGTQRPVIVYIHAGGFYSVTGRSDWAGPQYFLDQDIVLVTINYRLGSLGFMSTGEEVPGNNGLKDQVVALRWIRDNIGSFGGDPGSVTLFGYSAGAWSISLHLISPMSKGLFHRAIMGSGSAIGQWNLPSNQMDLAKKQARLVGCPDNGTVKEMVDCLKKVPAEVLGNSLGGFSEFHYDPIIIWYPVIEQDYGQERFLSEDPKALYERGDFANIPIVAGITQKEFGYEAFDIVNNETLLNLLNTDFETYAPIAFLYERETAKSKNISAALRNFYFCEQPLTNATLTGLSKIYADSIIGYPANKLANIISGKSSQKVYYYEFTYKGRYSHFYLPGTNETYGPVHHDDLIYLFYIAPLFPLFNEDYPESEMVEKLTLLWSTFARTGKPIPESGQIFEGVEWEGYDASTRKYLEIGESITLKEDLHRDRYEFWDKLVG